MNNFPKSPNDSIAGLASFLFVEAEGISSIPVPVLSKITLPVTLKIGYSWKTGYSAIDSLEYSEPTKKTDDGIYHIPLLRGFVPDQESMLQLLAEMQYRWFIVQCTDNDGLKRLVGTQEHPLFFSSDFETQTVSGQKGHIFKFSGVLKRKAPIYSI